MRKLVVVEESCRRYDSGRWIFWKFRGLAGRRREAELLLPEAATSASGSEGTLPPPKKHLRPSLHRFAAPPVLTSRAHNGPCSSVFDARARGALYARSNMISWRPSR